jgi:ADP-ribose pyrophosphatase YjhB (NUDIX family)
MPARHIRPKAVCVVRRGDALLLVDGWDPATGTRFHVPAGGGVEFGERAADAVRRELREELGVDVRLGDEVAADGGAWPLSDRYEMRVWLGVIVAGAPAPLTAHDDLRWLRPSEWDDLDWLDGDRPVLKALRRSRRFCEPASPPRHDRPAV